MAARYAVDGDSFRSDKPGRWSEQQFSWFFATPLARQNFALHPDGQRVVMAKPPDTQTSSSRHFRFVSSFFDDLRRAAPNAR